MARLGRGHTVATQPWAQWCEERRTAHDASTSRESRWTIRGLVRKQAAARGQPVPAWAARQSQSDAVRRGWEKRPHAEPKPKPDFEVWSEHRRAQHDACASAPARGDIRRKVRERAKARAVPVPAWAATVDVQPKVAKAPLPVRAPSEWKPRTIKQRRIDAPPAAPVDLGPLSAWRSRGYGRAVQLSGGRVTLHEYGSEPRAYPSVDAAVDAIGVADVCRLAATR